MPDLLAHALLAYALLRTLSWRYDWLTTPYVTAGMAGTFIPDIVKIQLLLPSATVEAVCLASPSRGRRSTDWPARQFVF